MKLDAIIYDLKSDLSELTDRYEKQRSVLKETLQNLIDTSANFDNNWIGQWAAQNYNHYNDFTRDGSPAQIDEDGIKKYIEDTCGKKFQDIEDEITIVIKAFKKIQEKVVTELSIIKGEENFVPEIELLDNIESQEWGFTRGEYVTMRRPQNIMTHDPFILNRGLDTPPHLNIGGELMSMISTIASSENLEKNIKRILRQLEIKLSIEDTPSSDKSDFIVKLINSFHIIARQLINRYDKRDSLIINDEYDVQDLLNSLLHIEFDDVRPEEYTPSYAGSSTRMDFLLKNEKIVIEVKKILDSQHYKAHPDCKHLTIPRTGIANRAK
jgi:hypothetical protein